MYYTVITKSGWQSDQFRLGLTFTSKKKAGVHAAQTRQSNPRFDNYHVEVKAHRKPIHELKNYDDHTVRFNDGTVAVF